MAKAVLGIDPGTNGGAVLITERGYSSAVRFGAAPSHEIVSVLYRWVNRYELKIFMEQVGAMASDYKPQLATFMRQTGFIDGVIELSYALKGVASDISYIAPVVWQTGLGVGGKGPYYEPNMKPSAAKAARKKWYHDKAKELFLGIKMTRDIADAFLIAEYGKRKTFGGKLNEQTEISAGTGVTRIVPGKRR